LKRFIISMKISNDVVAWSAHHLPCGGFGPCAGLATLFLGVNATLRSTTIEESCIISERLTDHELQRI